jgi:uncharacterized protein
MIQKINKYTSSIGCQILKKSKFILFFIGFLVIQTIAGQYKIPDTPKSQTSVYDYYKLLSESEKQNLETKLIRYSDTTATQIVVAVIKSTNGESIGVLAPRWAHKWGVGQAKEDNGIFILLARDDRKIWIAPGYGIEHLLTAGIIGELTRNVIIPEFKKGDYYSGLNKGIDAVFNVLNGSYKAAKKNSKKESSSIVFRILPILFFIILFIILSNRNKGGGKGGKRKNGFSILDAIILSSAGSHFGGSGGFGNSGSSGSFGGGFGGGGFSGGGAGGSW